MIGAFGCSNNNDENITPANFYVDSKLSHVDNYYKYAIKDEIPTKLYKAENVYLLFDKTTYDVNEYIFDTVFEKYGAQLYDLESEELLAYSSGLSFFSHNKEYYNYLVENNYQVCLKDACDYVENITNKEYYSLNEIKELEPKISVGLKAINSVKVKTMK